MGLGLTMWYPVDTNTKKEAYIELFRNLPSPVPHWETNVYFDDEGFRVGLVPFEEDLSGTWQEGALQVSSKTNSAGPGYHAWLVEQLDALENQLGAQPLEVEDETGYYEHRDFGKLQESMLGWLKGLSGQLLQMAAEGEYSELAVSMSLEWTPTGTGHFTSCPLGYFDQDFFERVVASKSQAEDKENAAAFFLWWEKEPDASFLKNCALYLMWCETVWLAPATDEERAIIDTILTCLERAFALNNLLTYPAAEWLELARLLGDEALTETLRVRFGETGAPTCGYRRGYITSTVFGWRLTHSGNMHFAHEDGESVWWDDILTIRPSSITVEFKEEVANKSEALLQSVLRDESGYEPFALKNPSIRAALQHSQYEEEGQPVWTTQLYAALDNNLLILSLYYTDKAKRDAAIKICASLSR